MSPKANVEVRNLKDRQPFSVVVVAINLFIAAVLAALLVNDYRHYLYVERLLNNPSIRLSPLALTCAFALPVLTMALWVMGAVLELKRSRLTRAYNTTLPVIVAAGIVFQFYFQFTSQTFLETQAVVALFDIPLLLISLLYFVIYVRRHERGTFRIRREERNNDRRRSFYRHR